jgi:hypothetical protein
MKQTKKSVDPPKKKRTLNLPKQKNRLTVIPKQDEWGKIDKIVGAQFSKREGVWGGIDHNIAVNLVNAGFLDPAMTHDHGMTVAKMIEILQAIPELRAEAIKLGNPGPPKITLNAFHVHGPFVQPTMKAFFLAVIDYADDINVSRNTLYAWFD